MHNRQRRLILKSMAALAAWSGIPSFRTTAAASDIGWNRWRLHSYGSGGRNIVQKLWTRHPDVCASRVAVVSGVDNLPPEALFRHDRGLGQGRAGTASSTSDETMPILAVAALGRLTGGDYSCDSLRRIRNREDQRTRIYGVVVRPFSLEDRAYERSLGQEHQLRGILDGLAVVENGMNCGGDTLFIDAINRADDEAIKHILGYLTI